MAGCKTGRNIQKYKGSGGTASTLQEALENSNTATIDINLISGAKFVGDGSGLTGISGTGGGVGNLQQVTNQHNSTTNSIIITNTGTSLTTSGTIISSGNITAPSFIGSGASLTGIALDTDISSNAARIGVLETDLTSNVSRVSGLETDLTSNTSRVSVLETKLTSNAARVGVLETDLSSNSTRITNLQNSTIISNSSGITDAFETGDLIYASGQNTLSNLSIGSTSQVLTVSGGIPVWTTTSGGGGGYWTQAGTLIHYTSGNVGIGTSSPTYPLHVIGNMNVTGGLHASGSSGTSGQVLTSSGGGSMSWSTVSGGGSSPWTTSGSDIYRSGGNVGIANTAPTNTFSVGTVVSIQETASSDVIIVRGDGYFSENVYIGKKLTVPVGGEIVADTIKCRSFSQKGTTVVAERIVNEVSLG